MQVLNIILPIFAIIFLGFWLRKKNIVKESWVHALNGFVYYVALPAVIFVSFWEISWVDSLMWKKLILGLSLLTFFAGFLAMFLDLFKLPKKTFVALFMSLLVGNTVYIGFPLVGSAFSQEQFPLVVSTASAFLVFGIIFSVICAEAVLVKGKRMEVYFKHFLFNPLILSLVLGLLFGFLDLQNPVFNLVKKPLAMLGTTASPLALFALGSFLSGKFVSKHFSLALWAALGKLVLLPVFFFLSLILLNVSQTEKNIFILLSAMPSAVTTFVIAEEYELDESLVANVILVSTALSIFSLSFILAMY